MKSLMDSLFNCFVVTSPSEKSIDDVREKAQRDIHEDEKIIVDKLRSRRRMEPAKREREIDEELEHSR